MKKNHLARLSGIGALLMLTLVSCGPKDADIQSAVQQKAETDLTMSGYRFSVAKGVVTVTGTAVSVTDKASDMASIGQIKGVRSVVDNTVLAAPPAPAAAPVTISPDDALQQGVMDATKDFPGVTATVQDGVVTLTGALQRSRLQNLMQSIQGLHPKKVENKLTLK